MKKILLPICAMLLCMTACKKDEGVLKLEIERYNTNAKVHIDGAHYAVWDNGDKIWLNGAEATVSISGNRGTIAIPESVEGATSYTAIYPYDWVEVVSAYDRVEDRFIDVLTIKYQNQTYRTIDGKQVVDAPMAAVSDGGTLRFTNLGSILAVTVSNPTDDPMSVTKIKVIANGDDVFINGGFPLSLDNDIRLDEIVWSTGTESNTITLDCPSVEIQRNGSHTFYIALPPMDNAMLTIKVYDYEGGYYMRDQSGTVEVDYGQNQLNQVTFNIDGNVYHSRIPNNQIWYTVSNNREIYRDFDNVADHGPNEDGYFIEFDDDVYEISEDPFRSARNLTSITLPQSVSSIEDRTFRSTTELLEVKCYSSSVVLGRNVFDSSSTQSGTLHLPEGANGNDWWDAGWRGSIVYDL